MLLNYNQSVNYLILRCYVCSEEGCNGSMESAEDHLHETTTYYGQPSPADLQHIRQVNGFQLSPGLSKNLKMLCKIATTRQSLLVSCRDVPDSGRPVIALPVCTGTSWCYGADSDIPQRPRPAVTQVASLCPSITL